MQVASIESSKNIFLNILHKQSLKTEKILELAKLMIACTFHQGHNASWNIGFSL